jgi:hypothetical protein
MNLDFNDLALRTIQSQYGASPHIIGIVEAAAKQLDPTGDIKTFYDKVFNPLTAEGVGLDIWGRIVGASRYLTVDNEEFFGFYGSQLNPFNQSPFFVSGDTDRFRLTDSAYRDLIFLKAAANIGTATLPSIKEILSALFEKPVLVMNIGEMKIRIVFTFYLSAYQRALLREYGVLNVGAGVGMEYYQIEPQNTFGFNGSDLQPFNQGIFQPYNIQEGDRL